MRPFNEMNRELSLSAQRKQLRVCISVTHGATHSSLKYMSVGRERETGSRRADDIVAATRSAVLRPALHTVC
jgi:hypothetical protein